MTIVAIQFAGLTIEDSRSDGQYHYTVRLRLRPCAEVDGKLVEITGFPRELLAAEGLECEPRTDLHYPETAGGGSPTVVEVNQAVALWIGATLTATCAAWLGRGAVAFVTAKPEE